MKLFVYEHITSGALSNEPLPDSLAHEGNSMLVALLNDLVQLAGIDLIILRDSRLRPLPDISHYHQCYTVHCADEYHHYYELALNCADAVLPIAPETDTILSTIQRSVLAKNKQLLASSPDASELCSDKYLCYQLLISSDIATVATVLASDWPCPLFSATGAYIIKPRDGAGCIDTLFFEHTQALENGLSKHTSAADNIIIQPYIQGHHISLNLLCSDTDCLLLAINQQHIKQNNKQLVFCGSIVNGVTENQLSFATADKLARQIYQAIKGLWGFIGIDLIVTDHAILVVDINPRLTSSYIGLANSIRQNPAKLLFTMMENASLSLSPVLKRHPVGVLL